MKVSYYFGQDHLDNIEKNIQKFKDKTLDWELPYCNEEIKIDRNKSFNTFQLIGLLETFINE